MAQMKKMHRRSVGAHLAAAGAALALAAVMASPAAAADTAPADLRVMATNGRQLDHLIQYSGTTQMPTSSQALCFGPGSGGSGNPVTVPSTTALGAVVEAAESRAGLKPLLLTDDFVDDGFGLGVCGIGGELAAGSAFWYAKVNHRGLQVGGSQFEIGRNDEVLWYLAPNFPPPPELVLTGPHQVPIGTPLVVSVVSYDDNGVGSPAAGATVSGGSAPVVTDPSGKAVVEIEGTGPRTLVATRGADIPSALTPVCVADTISNCSAVPGRLIVGSSETDGIRGTAGPDVIRPRGGPDGVQARGGDDRVNVRGGGADGVNCGGGDDLVKAGKADKVSSNCEKVNRKRKKGKRKK